MDTYRDILEWITQDVEDNLESWRDGWTGQIPARGLLEWYAECCDNDALTDPDPMLLCIAEHVAYKFSVPHGDIMRHRKENFSTEWEPGGIYYTGS